MFKPFIRNQDFLLPPSLRDIIPEDDLVYRVAEVTELLNLRHCTTDTTAWDKIATILPC